MNGGIEYYFLVSSRKLFFLITEEKIFYITKRMIFDYRGEVLLG
jgi:hypothetical protein